MSQESCAPSRDPQLLGYLAIRPTRLATQYDARLQRQRLRGFVPARPFDQPIVLFRCQDNGLKFWSAAHRFSLDIYSNFGHRGRINVLRINDSGH
jgi:hypothetical protein